MAKLNTNSNAYTIIYACVLVIIVAFLLAFVASALKPTQDANVALDTKKQILSALNIRDCADADAKYNEVITEGELNSPVLKANVDGEEKLVVAVKGAGLWGPLWGWVSINKDGQTVYGTFFNHESETAGLGARIKEQWFQDNFQGKQIFADGKVALGVYKAGKAPATLSTDYYVDAVTGATLTSNGVNDMIQKCLTENKAAIDAFKGGSSSDCQAKADCSKSTCADCCKDACGDCCKDNCGDCCKEACGDCCKDACADCCKDACGECCKEKACADCCKDNCADCCKDACGNCCKEKACDTPCNNNKE